MDIQEMIDNAMVARRAKEMLTSPQLTLGELILKLEAVDDKKLPIVFDGKKYHPVNVDSWRGAYDELAIEYSLADKVLSVKKFLKMLKNTVSKTFIGYKGGNFLMGRTTPVWVANYGESQGFKEEEDKYCQAIVDIIEGKKCVIIKTKAIDY